MDQRGRTSLSAAETSNIHSIARQEAPDTLTDRQKEIWNRIVQSVKPEWFGSETIDLLVAYCGHVSMHEQLCAELNELGPGSDTRRDLLKDRERESRAMAMLATKMRISQQATIDPETRKNKGSSKASKPWEK